MSVTTDVYGLAQGANDQHWAQNGLRNRPQEGSANIERKKPWETRVYGMVYLS